MNLDNLTDDERDVYLAELKALRGSLQSVYWAEHAVERHRSQIGAGRKHRPALPPGQIEFAAAALRAGCEAFGVDHADYVRDGQHLRPARAMARAFACVVLKAAYGSGRAGSLVGLTDGGFGSAVHRLHSRAPELAARAVAMGAAEKARLPVGRAAGTVSQ